MSIKHIPIFQKHLTTILLISIIFVYSCSSNNSITGGSENLRVEKPTDIFSSDNPPKYGFQGFEIPQDFVGCILLVDLFAPYLLPTVHIYPIKPDENKNQQNEWIEDSYEFKDNYLAKSNKGMEYIYSYYKLSEYSIKYNLIGEYYKEHIQIIPLCIDIARTLQYKDNSNEILFNETAYNDLNEIVNIYRNSKNYEEIEPVLIYLEADLKKYYNKSKAEIAADFRF